MWLQYTANLLLCHINVQGVHYETIKLVKSRDLILIETASLK